MKAMAWAFMPIFMLGTAAPVIAAESKQDEKADEAPVAVPPVSDAAVAGRADAADAGARTAPPESKKPQC